MSFDANHDNGRFERQAGIIPPELLCEAAATVIGVGAIGRQVALQLAAIGVARIQLIDFDHVEPANVTSQGYWHADAQQRRAKVEATREAILSIDPALQVEAVLDRYRPRLEIYGVLPASVKKSVGAGRRAFGGLRRPVRWTGRLGGWQAARVRGGQVERARPVGYCGPDVLNLARNA